MNVLGLYFFRFPQYKKHPLQIGTAHLNMPTDSLAAIALTMPAIPP
jgi:hypothetical protein